MDRPLIVVIAALAILALSCAPEPAVSEAVPLHWISADMGPGIGVVERATVMVDVLVDSKPAWLQLDTGATYTTLTPSVLDALGVRYRKGVKAEGWGLPGATMGRVNGLSVGGATLRNAEVMLWERTRPGSPGPKVDVSRHAEHREGFRAGPPTVDFTSY